MNDKRPLDARTLWQFSRIGAVALSPNGQHAVCSVASTDIDKNQNHSHLWLLHTSGRPPRQLTHCGGKDGQPAWSPRGDCIAFVASREQEGAKDPTPQLYVVPADGGEARRLTLFGPGVQSFKWLPDGRRIVFAAWVWPELRTAAQQNHRHKTWHKRQETGLATSQGFYRFWDHFLPQDRALHLLLLDVASGRISDLFAGTGLELPRHDSGSAGYDVNPDGQTLVFNHDPAAERSLANPWALAELNIKTRHVTPLLQDPAWDFSAPRYSPNGQQVAAIGAHVGRVHTALGQLVVANRALPAGPSSWQALGANWDHAVNAPLRWSADGHALFFTAEERGRCHLWRHLLDSPQFEVVVQGGWVQGFDVAAGVQLVAADSARHPVRVHAQLPGAAPQRLESFNDSLLQTLQLGDVHEVQLRGAPDPASGDAVQMWLTFPPGFKPGAGVDGSADNGRRMGPQSRRSAKQKLPITHVVHGGPFAAAGDSFGYRWNAQVLAAAGHVVAQVNYHGSSGFGHAFRHSLIGRQGQLEMQDIEAGTDWLLQQPWADEKRVFATGGSYGGFLVAWMNGQLRPWPQGRYRAYICHAGVFDRVSTFSADSYPERPKDLAATYWQDMPRVLAQSPHAFAAQMNTPTLVVHGALDYRVPDCNGLACYNTLKARGVDARLLWFADENHWVLKPQNSLQWYAEFAAWLKRHSGRALPRSPLARSPSPRRTKA